jgi:phosphohistidine phosphatase
VRRWRDRAAAEQEITEAFRRGHGLPPGTRFHPACDDVAMTETVGRKLVLLRHAKSAWPDVPDHDRPLARRGRRDAPAMGRWMRTAGYVPDQVLCSTARRARETWQLAQAALRADPPVSFERRVYQASAAELLDLAHRTPAAVRTLLVIGHDPAIPELALLLAGAAPPAGRDAAPGAASPAAFDRMRAKFPTAAIAVLELAGSWRQLAAGTARLAGFVTPRELAGTGGDPANGR